VDFSSTSEYGHPNENFSLLETLLFLSCLKILSDADRGAQEPRKPLTYLTVSLFGRCGFPVRAIATDLDQKISQQNCELM